MIFQSLLKKTLSVMNFWSLFAECPDSPGSHTPISLVNPLVLKNAALQCKIFENKIWPPSATFSARPKANMKRQGWPNDNLEKCCINLPREQSLAVGRGFEEGVSKGALGPMDQEQQANWLVPDSDFE